MPDALSPAQLDRIEDALEHLERDGVDALMSAGEPDAAVEDVLAAYHSILQLTREALPPVEVPAGLLDDVLAQAHTAATAAAASTPEVRVPWYRRVKWNVWGPGLAFAATAAVLLVVVRPASDDASSAEARDAKVAQRTPASPPPPEDPAKTEVGDDRLADATRLAEAEADADADEKVGRGEGLLGDLDAERRRDDAEPAAAEDVPVQEAQQVEKKLSLGSVRKEEKAKEEDYGGVRGGLPGAGGGGSLPSTNTKTSGASGGKVSPSEPAKKKGGSSSNAGPTPAPTTSVPKAEPTVPAAPPPEPKPSPAPKDVVDDAGDEAWASVVTGDTRRNAGNCNGAKAAYQEAAKAAGEDRTRARALAGLGLCALAAGDDKGAESYFTKARKADPSVGSFIDGERAKLGVDNAANAAEVDE